MHTGNDEKGEEKDWDSDDSVCLMEDVSKSVAEGFVLLKSVRVKPKLSKMGDDSLMIGKHSAMMRSKRWTKDREARLQIDKNDAPVRLK